MYVLKENKLTIGSLKKKNGKEIQFMFYGIKWRDHIFFHYHPSYVRCLPFCYIFVIDIKCFYKLLLSALALALIII